MSDEPTRILQQQILDRLGSVETRMGNLEERVDKRLAETRPIWERVLAELEAMRHDMEIGFRTLSKKVEILNKQVLEVRADQGLIEDRVEKLEPKT